MKINRMNFFIPGIILVVSISLLTGCSESKSSQGKGNIIKVGVAQAFTGSASPYGESVRKGVVLAAKQINSQEYIGQGKILQFIMEDTGGDQEKAKTVFKRFMTQDKVVAIIGPTSSNCSFAADQEFL
jgi:branched-chain amino acid transport system substrate-binding protein